MVAELPEVFIKTIVVHKHVRHERREINAGDPFALMGSDEWSETPWVWLSFSKLHLKWIPTDFELWWNLEILEGIAESVGVDENWVAILSSPALVEWR